MTERRTNLVFIAVFSVLAVVFVAFVLLISAAIFFSGASSFPRTEIPPKSSGLPD